MTRPESRSPLALGLFSYILFFLIVPIILYHAELPPFPGDRRFIYFVLLGPFAALWTHGSVFVMAMLAMMILPLWIALLERGSQGDVGKPLRWDVAFVWQRDGRYPDVNQRRRPLLSSRLCSL